MNDVNIFCWMLQGQLDESYFLGMMRPATNIVTLEYYDSPFKLLNHAQKMITLFLHFFV